MPSAFVPASASPFACTPMPSTPAGGTALTSAATSRSVARPRAAPCASTCTPAAAAHSTTSAFSIARGLQLRRCCRPRQLDLDARSALDRVGGDVRHALRAVMADERDVARLPARAITAAEKPTTPVAPNTATLRPRRSSRTCPSARFSTHGDHRGRRGEGAGRIGEDGDDEGRHHRLLAPPRACRARASRSCRR